MNTLAIITPVYNGSRYLTQTIKSVLSQPCKDYVHIIMDDGSTDDSLQIAESFRQGNSNVIVLHQANQGVSAARNAAMDFCFQNDLARYVMFLDADDLMVNGFYDERLCSYLCEQNADTYGFSHFYATEDMKNGYYISGQLFEGKINQVTKAYHFSSYLYKSELLKKWNIRFPQQVRLDEDTAFKFIFMTFIQSFCYVDKPIFLYRNNGDSTCAQEGLRGESFVKDDGIGFVLQNQLPGYRFMENELLRIYKDFPCKNGKLQDLWYCEYLQHNKLMVMIIQACRRNTPVHVIKEKIASSEFRNLFTEEGIYEPTEELKQMWDEFINHPEEFAQKSRCSDKWNDYDSNILRNGDQNYLKENFRIDLVNEGIVTL